MNPGYSIQQLHQASGRTARSEAKSKATVRMVYGKLCNCDTEDLILKEQRILDALTRKNKTYKSYLDQAVKDGIKFPGEYDVMLDEIQPDMMDDEYYFNTDAGINKLTLQETKDILAGTKAYIPKKGSDPDEDIITVELGERL